MGPGIWARVWAFLVLGYALWGRTFAYLGIPSLKVFIGEVALAVFAFARPDRLFGPWLAWLMGQGPAVLVIMAWALGLFFLYGVFEGLRGWLIVGYEPLAVLQNLVFNVYPFYMFLGLWIGRTHPTLIQVLVRWLSWANGIYGMLYILFLNHLGLSLPWALDVPLFGQPGGSALALLGLLALEPQLKRVWPILALNLFVLLGVQVRGEWLAFTVGLLVWAVLRRDLSRMVFWSFSVVLIFVLMYALDLRIPAPEQRGGEISLRGVVARAIAPFNPEGAAELIGEEAYSFAGTVTGWRIPWWLSIWEEVHQDSISALFGPGYGFPLYSLLSFIPEGIRTPHNVFFYALGYGGWLGVAFFFAFQLSLGYSLYRAALQVRNPLGPMLWAGLFSSAFFGNFFETPFGAIPFYLLMGYCLAPLTQTYACVNASHPVSTAWR